jgi:hypothetical protein
MVDDSNAPQPESAGGNASGGGGAAGGVPPTTELIIHSQAQRGRALPALEGYVWGIRSASARTRWMTIVITIASVVVFFGYWNALDMSWLRSRLNLAVAARDVVLHPSAARNPDISDTVRDRLRRAEDYLRRRHIEPSRMLVRVPFSSVGAQVDSLEGRSACCGSSQPGITQGEFSVDLALFEVERTIGELERAEIESIKVLDVPFLGVVIDVNDLGLWAGVAFVILLLMRRMYLSAERDGLLMLFRRGYEEGSLREAYELATMAEVFTVPTRLPGHGGRGVGVWTSIFRIMPLLLDFAPAVLLMAIYMLNLESEPVGRMISPSNTTLSVTASGVLFVVALFLTVICARAEVEIHRVLDTVAFSNEAGFLSYFGFRAAQTR